MVAWKPKEQKVGELLCRMCKKNSGVGYLLDEKDNLPDNTFHGMFLCNHCSSITRKNNLGRTVRVASDLTMLSIVIQEEDSKRKEN